MTDVNTRYGGQIALVSNLANLPTSSVPDTACHATCAVIPVWTSASNGVNSLTFKCPYANIAAGSKFVGIEVYGLRVWTVKNMV